MIAFRHPSQKDRFVRHPCLPSGSDARDDTLGHSARIGWGEGNIEKDQRVDLLTCHKRYDGLSILIGSGGRDQIHGIF